MHRKIQKEVTRTVEKNVKELSKWGKIFFNKPILKFFIFIIIQIILVSIVGFYPGDSLLRLSINIINILIFIYFAAVIVFLITHWFKKLLNPKNLATLIFTYILLIIAILVLFATFYNLAELSGYGYLKYGQCSDKFDSSLINSDPYITREFFYFSSMTFFTVGYGDICAMGLNKEIAILNAFIGHLVSVVIVVLVINNYFRKKGDSDG